MNECWWMSVEDIKRFEALSGFGDIEASLLDSWEYPNLVEKVDGVLHVPIRGPSISSGSMAKYRYFGFPAVSYTELLNVFNAAGSDTSIQEVHLHVDSSGGMADRLDEVWQAIKALTKPVKAFVEGKALSAGYYLASAADEIVALSPNAFLGSVGVVASRPSEDPDGVRTFVSSNASRKRTQAGSDAERESVMAVIDALEARFLQRIASSRGEKVRDNILTLEGQYIVAESAGSGVDALTLGMIDRIEQQDAPAKKGTTMDEEMKALRAELVASQEAWAAATKDGEEAKAALSAMERQNKLVAFAASVIGETKYAALHAAAARSLKGELKGEVLQAMVELVDSGVFAQAADDVADGNDGSEDVAADANAKEDAPVADENMMAFEATKELF